MKKYIALLLSLIMMLQVSACGTSENTAEPAVTLDKTESKEPAEVQEMSDSIVPEAKDEFEDPVFTEINEKSIGANAELLATLKSAASVYEYKLNPEDYDVSFELYVGDEESWMPYVGSRETSFAISEESVVDYSVKNKKKLEFIAVKAGECVITASQKDKTSTAYVRVLAQENDMEASNSVEYYMLYIANEIAELDSEGKAEYLLNLGEYAAVSQAGGVVDGNLVNAMAAACLIYPHAGLLNNYATLLMGRNQYEEALVWLKQADEGNPNDPYILTNMGECFYELGDYDSALRYTERAIGIREDFGLAHLIQACIYAQRGSFEQFVTSLFKSAKTCWCELTGELMKSLQDYVTEYRDEHDEMLITKEHLELLMEAAGYGTTSVDQNMTGEKISLPFPAPNTMAALTAEESYAQQAQALEAQIDEMYGGYQEYQSHYQAEDARHVMIARFHILYYEWLIENNSCSKSMFGEEYERIGENFEKSRASLLEPYQEKIQELEGEIGYHALTGMGSILAAPFDDSHDWVAEMQVHGAWLEEHYMEYYKEILLLNLEAVKTEETEWHNTLIRMEQAKMDGYETITRPILEEYYHRMSIILSYMTNDAARQNFEKRVLWLVNDEGIRKPLGLAGAQKNDVTRYQMAISFLYSELDEVYQQKYVSANEKAQANLEKARQEKARAEREKWGSGYQIGLPPLSPIQVYIGCSADGNLTYGYGAFGHDIMYERDKKTGNTIQTITSTSSASMPALGQLDQTVAGLKDIHDSIEGLRDIEGALITLDNVVDYAQGQVVGGLPSVDGRVARGTINVYNKDGELIDTSRFRSTSASGGAGLINIGVETTSTNKYRGQINLVNTIDTKTKAKINIGGFSFEKEVDGALPGH